MKVFISHAPEDQALATRVAAGLRTAGFQVDDSEVFPGDNWAEQTASALRDANALVVLLTPHALQASQLGHEVSYALGKPDFKGRVVPVYAVPSAQLPKEQIPWVLNKFPAVNLSEIGSEEGMRQIAQVLHDAA